MPSEPYIGKFRGQVLSTADPSQRGKVQVAVPHVLGDTPAWAMPCMPFASPSKRREFLPPVGTDVWVEFEAGDPGRPIWVGCFWE